MLLLFFVIDVLVFLNCTMKFFLDHLDCLEGNNYLILLFVVAEILVMAQCNLV